MSDLARFVVAAAAGIPLAILGLIGGLIVMAAMLVAAVLTWANFGRMAFAGIAISLGATWTTLFVASGWQCARPDQPCGATPPDMTLLSAAAAGLAVLGLAALTLEWRARPKARN